MTEPVWQAQALADRQAIVEHLTTQSNEAALNWDQDLAAKLSQAAANPAALPAGRVPGTLELVLLPHYVLVAQAPSEHVPFTVLRVLHTSKTWP